MLVSWRFFSKFSKKMSDPGGVLSFCKAFVATFAFSFCPGRTKFAFLANAEAPRAPSPRRLKRKARPKVGITDDPWMWGQRQPEVGGEPGEGGVFFFKKRANRQNAKLFGKNACGPKNPAGRRRRWRRNGDEMDLFE